MLASNKISAIGALVRPGNFTLRGESKTPIFEGTVAMTSKVDGRDHTAYLPVYAVGNAAKRLSENTTAGTAVHLDGVVRQKKWTDKGVKHSRTRVQILRSEVVVTGSIHTDKGGGFCLLDGQNNATIGGNMVATPVLRNTKADGTGDAVTTFSVALNSNYKDASGERIEQVDYVDVIAWRELAVKVASLPKGAALMIEGAAVSEAWKDDKGQNRSALKFQAVTLNVVIPPVLTTPVKAAPVEAAPVAASPVAGVQAAAEPVFEAPAEEFIPDDAYPSIGEEGDLPF